MYALKSTPVFPPILESTCARRDVGTCIKLIPLRYPVKSPTTPPPSATSISFLSKWFLIRNSYTSSTVSRFLLASPASNTNVNTLLPVFNNCSSICFAYKGATLLSDTIQSFLPVTPNLSNSSANLSKLCSITILYKGFPSYLTLIHLDIIFSNPILVITKLPLLANQRVAVI